MKVQNLQPANWKNTSKNLIFSSISSSDNTKSLNSKFLIEKLLITYKHCLIISDVPFTNVSRMIVANCEKIWKLSRWIAFFFLAVLCFVWYSHPFWESSAKCYLEDKINFAGFQRLVLSLSNLDPWANCVGKIKVLIEWANNGMSFEWAGLTLTVLARSGNPVAYRHKSYPI